MAPQTKEQILEQLMNEEKPKCPHCDEEMKLWEIPPVPFSDGLGWGEPYLYLCFNDDCPVYVNGWEDMKENFGQISSQRCLCYPSNRKFEYMPVFSPMGGQGQMIDEQVVAEQELLKEAIKKGFSILSSCYVEKDWVSVLNVLIDSTEPTRVRLKAAEMIGDYGSLDMIEPIQNSKFGNEILQKQVNEAITGIHKRHFTRECPFCAEIIKKRAKICKHCSKEVAGV